MRPAHPPVPSRLAPKEAPKQARSLPEPRKWSNRARFQSAKYVPEVGLGNDGPVDDETIMNIQMIHISESCFWKNVIGRKQNKLC